MDDATAVGAEFQLAGLEFGNRASQIGGHRAGLGVGHQTTGTENPTQLGHLGHHVRGGDQEVKVHRPGGNFFDQIVVAGYIGTGGLRFGHLFASGDHGDADGLAGAVGQGHGGAQLLVGVLGVDAETDVSFDGFIEFGVGVGLHQFESL